MIYRTRAAPSPPIISINSDPFIDRNGTEASVATAFARRVFPQPGGPNNKAPLGTYNLIYIEELNHIFLKTEMASFSPWRLAFYSVQDV